MNLLSIKSREELVHFVEVIMYPCDPFPNPAIVGAYIVFGFL